MRTFHIPRQFKQLPGWINLLEDYGNLTKEEIAKIEQDDYNEMVATSEAEKYWRREEVPKVHKLIAEDRRENEDEYYKCRIRYFVTQKKEWKEKQDGLIKIFEKMCEQNDTLENKKKVTEMIQGCQKKIDGIQKGLDILSGKSTGITDEMIDAARAYPIEKIVEVNERGFALCVGHKDNKPSMFCKNNFAHCFSCGYQADTIKLIMDVKGMSFIKAVQVLNI